MSGESVRWPIAYVGEVIEATKLCVKYGMIDRREAIRGIENIIKRYGELHKSIEIALENLIEFKKRLESGEDTF